MTLFDTVKTAEPSAKLAAKFRKLAEAMPEKIEHLRRPMTQNSTPKRQREYASRCIDGDNLERGRLACLALADAWDRGEVPEILQSLRTKDDVCRLVRHGIESTGYYSIHSTHQYADQSEAGKALQALLESFTGSETKEQQEATKKKRELERLIDRVRFLEIPGFFPTPLAIIGQIIQLADISAYHHVLEPSAGVGDIADAIRKTGAEPIVCELCYSLCEILSAKGYQVVSGDFLERFSVLDPVQGVGEVEPEMKQWERIVMNPPFENQADIDHVRHAHKLLRANGRLVSVMSTGPFFRDNRKAVEFREWFESVNGEKIDLPDNGFEKGFRSTGVKTCLVVIDA